MSLKLQFSNNEKIPGSSEVHNPHFHRTKRIERLHQTGYSNRAVNHSNKTITFTFLLQA